MTAVSESGAPAPRQKAPVATAPGFDPGASCPGELVALRAAFGQDEANHGTQRYRVDNDGLVRVPRDAVGFLIGNGGFVVAAALATAQRKPAAMVKLHHADAAGCSYGGREYPADTLGDVLVPAEAVGDLLVHGFVAPLDPLGTARSYDTAQPAPCMKG